MDARDELFRNGRLIPVHAADEVALAYVATAGVHSHPSLEGGGVGGREGRGLGQQVADVEQGEAGVVLVPDVVRRPLDVGGRAHLGPVRARVSVLALGALCPHGLVDRLEPYLFAPDVVGG